MSQCNRLTDLVSSAPERAAALSGELASHVESCAQCQTEVQAATRLTELLAGHHGALEPADDAVTRALSRVRGRDRTRSSSHASVRVWGPLAAAAALAGCVGLIVWWAHGRMTADPVKPSVSEVAPLVGSSSTPTVAEGAPEPLAESPWVGPPQVALPNGVTVGLHVTGCPAEDDARCRPGQTLFARTTVQSFTLSDQTTLTLNSGSQVVLSTDRKRGIEIVQGEVLIDVVKQAPLPPLEVRTEHGLVIVTGTQLQVTRAPTQTLVDVIRGRVEVDGQPLGAGQEAVLTSKRAPIIRAAPDLAEATRWTEIDAGEAEGSMGLGSLMARRPGAKGDSEEALRLTDHRVNVRIQGQLARTEIEEAFHNDTDKTLEGIYTFPMPGGARIAGLELLVDGEWHEGAMVERERGEKIWRGVIRNAAPKHTKRDVVEYIWIPGPWRDPALLTWRGGSTFELRIFPIEAGSERRVRIAYIEDLKRTAGGHRYVYPLAVPKDPSVRAERFEFNAHLSGDIDGAAVRSAPYRLESKVGASPGETVLSTSARNFVPAGDLVIDIPQTHSRAELRSWTYRAPTEKNGFALLSLRPDIPSSTGQASNDGLDVLFVVDTSYATQRARLDRAGRLVGRMTRALGQESRVHVIGCAAECHPIGPGFQSAGSVVAADLALRIKGIEPMGATWLTHSFERSLDLLKRSDARRDRARVVYLGDGVATMGETEPARVARSVAAAAGDVRTILVSLGGDVDELMMRTIAGAANGSYVAHGSRDSLRGTTLRAMRRLTDQPLRDVELVFPAGLMDVTPSRLGTIWPGEERRIAARLAGSGSIGDLVLRGRLNGKPFERRIPLNLKPSERAGNAFLPRVWAELRIDELQSTGGDSERDEIVELSKMHHVLSRYTSMIVLESAAMARAFKVEPTRPAVEWTGESADESSKDSAPIGSATAVGEFAGQEGNSGIGDTAARSKKTKKRSTSNTRMPSSLGKLGVTQDPNSVADLSTGRASRANQESRAHVRQGAARTTGSADPRAIQRVLRRSSGKIRRLYETSLKSNPNLQGRLELRITVGPGGRVTNVTSSRNDRLSEELKRLMRRTRFPATGSATVISFPLVFRSSNASVGSITGQRGGRYVKRKKVWYREATVVQPKASGRSAALSVESRRSALSESPHSRNRTQALVRALVRAGDLDGAEFVVAEWLERDRMDAGALVSAADLAGLRGDPNRSRDLLSSAVDADPRNGKAHARMLELYRAADAPSFACAHALSGALASPSDFWSQAQAVWCGVPSERLLPRLSKSARRKAVRALKRGPNGRSRLRGSMKLTARWKPVDGDTLGEPTNVDIVVVTPKGRRVSWQGGAKTTSSVDSHDLARESLGMSTGELGRYQILIVPQNGAVEAVKGKLVVRVHGVRKTFRFDTSDGATRVADVVVKSRSRWETVN